jgi:hypothetical protein
MGMGLGGMGGVGVECSRGSRVHASSSARGTHTQPRGILGDGPGVWGAGGLGGMGLGGVGGAVEASNQVDVFTYSVPFTLAGKSHAKTMDDQWMLSTLLTVPQPFPFIMTRQEVLVREVRTFAPIEVAINDIEGMWYVVCRMCCVMWYVQNCMSFLFVLSSDPITLDQSIYQYMIYLNISISI